MLLIQVFTEWPIPHRYCWGVLHSIHYTAHLGPNHLPGPRLVTTKFWRFHTELSEIFVCQCYVKFNMWQYLLENFSHRLSLYYESSLHMTFFFILTCLDLSLLFVFCFEIFFSNFCFRECNFFPCPWLVQQSPPWDFSERLFRPTTLHTVVNRRSATHATHAPHRRARSWGHDLPLQGECYVWHIE